MKTIHVLQNNVYQPKLAELQIEAFAEQDWKSTQDWYRMACFLLATDAVQYNRKLLQFAYGCARQSWKSLALPSQKALILSEMFADNIVIDEELRQRVEDQARDVSFETGDQSSICYQYCIVVDSLNYGIFAVDATTQRESQIDRSVCADYFRDLVYNPFHEPPSIDDSWLYAHHSAVYLLAQDIYYGYRFDRLCELADALEHAGCTNPMILDHCRSTGPHLRGCWVLDLLLEPHRNPFKRLLSQAPIPGDRVAAYFRTNEPRDPFSLYS
jgi:hypothetical protein